ncbi:MAG: hypothetical protein WCA81_01335, partial [Rhizomicrobium sp.]
MCAEKERKLEEIEITPEMIEAGLNYLRAEAFPMLTVRAEDPEFVIGFFKSIMLAGPTLSCSVRS